MIPPAWLPYHRLDDDELLGYIAPASDPDTWVPVTVFGHPLGVPGTRLAAETRLEETGLSYLAQRWQLALEDGRSITVLISEAGPGGVVVTNADHGYEGDFATRFTLGVPDEARERLTPE